MFRKIFNKKRLLYFANSKKRLKFALEKKKWYPDRVAR